MIPRVAVLLQFEWYRGYVDDFNARLKVITLGRVFISSLDGGRLMEQIKELDFKIKEIAGRIKELREIENLSVSEMAQKTAVSEEEYIACENGQSDLHFAFIYRCANAFNVDVTDIIEGYSPKLKSYTVTRVGEGQRIEKAHGMTYYNLASAFKNRIAEPLYVESVYSEEAQTILSSY